MVFQNYALYPHKTVYENLAFPLKMRGEKKDEVERKVRAAAESLGIKELLDRRPRELSGGQQQRVALGRAVVRNPQVFLMDEPLSNLDAKLRVQTRAEIKRLHSDLNATVVYVTHDQLEAMTMSDRVAVMGGGQVHQYGTPLEVFDAPADLFVASFIGSPAMNIMRGTLAACGGVAAPSASGRVAGRCRRRCTPPPQAMNAGPEVAYGVRHRDLGFHRSEKPDSVHGIVYAVEPTGDITYVHVRVGSDPIVASVEPDEIFAPDQDVWLTPNLDRLYFFDGVSGLAIREKGAISPGMMPRATFASEAMAVEDTPVPSKCRIPTVTGRVNLPPGPLP